MNYLFKLFHKSICILATITCYQVAATDLQVSCTPTYHTIKNFEIDHQVDELLLLIQKRLVIMHEVARTKWNQNLPIEDKIREQQILANLANQASQYGLDKEFVIRFFQAQINASKEVQRKDFVNWKENGQLQFDKIFSLKDDLRLCIDHLNSAMFLLLSKIYTNSFIMNDNCILLHPISIRASDYIDDDIWLMAISPLLNN